jgi:hypothetical protein
MMRDTNGRLVDELPTPLLKWSAIFGGLILGLATLTLLTALWFAMAYGSNIEGIRQNLDWFVGGSAIVALFLGGVFTGYLSGVHGAGTGALHGMTLWGLLLMITVIVGVPSVVGTLGLEQTVDQATAITPIRVVGVWAGFWTILGGFVAAGLGGMIGGAMTRRETTVPPPPAVGLDTPTQPESPIDLTDTDDRDHDDEEVVVAGRRYRAV